MGRRTGPLGPRQPPRRHTAVTPSLAPVSGAALMEQIKLIVRRYRAEDPWTAYSANSLTKAGAGIYVQQHGVFTRHSRRAWAYVVGNCTEAEVRRFIVRENLFEEEGSEETSHYLKLVRMGEALGLSAREVHEAKPLPSTRASLNIWETLTKDRHWIIGAAAKGAMELETTAGIEGGRWMEQLGLSRESVDFWLLHHEADAVHGSGSLDLVMKYLPCVRGVDQGDILTAVEDSLFAFVLFRRGIVAAATGKA